MIVNLNLLQSNVNQKMDCKPNVQTFGAIIRSSTLNDFAKNIETTISTKKSLKVLEGIKSRAKQIEKIKTWDGKDPIVEIGSDLFDKSIGIFNKKEVHIQISAKHPDDFRRIIHLEDADYGKSEVVISSAMPLKAFRGAKSIAKSIVEAIAKATDNLNRPHIIPNAVKNVAKDINKA